MPLHQPFFVMDFFFFRDTVSYYLPGWLGTSILLISASWVNKITGVTHRHRAQNFYFDGRDNVEESQTVSYVDKYHKEAKLKPGTVAQACNPSYLGGW
jgi:hypothetical protein